MIAACDDHTLYTNTDLLKPGHGGSTDRDEVISDLMHSMLNSVVCANDHSNRYNARQCEPGVSCLAYRRIWLAPKSKRKQQKKPASEKPSISKIWLGFLL